MDNKLAEIVPPYRLCNFIPARCFTDSYAVYPCYYITHNFDGDMLKSPYDWAGVPMAREYWNNVVNKSIESGVTKYAIPAPTLEEILKEFAIYRVNGDIEDFKCQKGLSEFANGVADLIENEIKLLLSCQATTLRPVPTSASEALELWLKLKGIKDEHL